MTLKTFLFGSLTLFITFGISFAQSIEFEFPYGNEFTDNPSTNISTMIKSDVIQANDSYFKGLLSIFRIDQFTNSGNQAALGLIKYIINILLGLVVLIALVILIYGFGQIFFAKDSEGLSTAKRITINASIAIAIIAVSWLIVSFLINIYSGFTSGP